MLMVVEGSLHTTKGEKGNTNQATNPSIYSDDLPKRYTGI